MLVVGTATAVGVTLANDRRLAPALADGAPVPHTPPAPALRIPATPAFDIRSALARWLVPSLALAVAFIAIVAAIPAITTVATHAAATPAVQGPPSGIRAGAAAGGNWERSWSIAVPPAGELGAAVLAARQHEQDMEVVRQLLVLAEQKKAEEQRQSAVASARTQRSVGGPAASLNRASGYAPGTILRARITVYGCTGPGGGFCGGMASGFKVFEGAAACSYDMPFGTKLRIIGDPTGRVYECLDRGALSAPWVDVFFNNTSEGIAWASLLGGTVSDIEIVN